MNNAGVEEMRNALFEVHQADRQGEAPQQLVEVAVGVLV